MERIETTGNRTVSVESKTKRRKKFIYNRQRVLRVKRINLKRFLIRFGWILLIGLVFLGLEWGVVQLRVKNFECRSQYGNCPIEVDDWLDNYSIRSPLAIWNNLIDELRYRFPQVSNANLSWVGLNTVRLDLIVDDPVVIVTTERLMQEKKYFEVSLKGKIINEVNFSKNLPMVVLNQLNNGVGESLSSFQQQAIKIIKQMMFRGYEFEIVKQINEDTLKIKLYSGESILFSLNREMDADRLVSALQLILSQATIEGDKLQVDMRFKQPVVRDLSVVVIPSSDTTESGKIVEKVKEDEGNSH